MRIYKDPEAKTPKPTRQPKTKPRPNSLFFSNYRRKNKKPASKKEAPTRL